jgi:DNA ligase (NAD+)
VTPEYDTGLGEDTAPVVHEYLVSEVGRRTLQDLKSVGVDLASKDHKAASSAGSGSSGGVAAAGTSGPVASVFSGKTIVITGTLDAYERTALTDLLESLGAKVSGSVSKKTHLLIAGREAGSKLEKAEELGVEIWDETKLLQALHPLPPKPPA